MNEQRMQAYVNLIQQLLSCPDGQQNQILSDNRDLLDEGLVMAMQAMAQHFADNGQENTVRYLLSMAQQLAEALGMNTTPASYTAKNYVNFLMTVLQTIAESQGNPEIVYPLFQQNQGMLDETLAVILKQWGQETFKRVSPEEAHDITGVIVNFGNLIQQFPLGHKPDNMELGITAFQLALEVRTREAFPVDWAMTQNNLGIAYRNRIKEDRGENLELAISSFQLALEVRTRDAFPVDWATTQNNLGNAYVYRIKEDRGENLELAIAAFQLALEVRTRDAFPVQWAAIQNNLGIAYKNCIKEDRGENLELAISSFQLALEVRTRDAFPVDWAATQNNLGNAYKNRIKEDRGENLELAICAFQKALEVRTRDAFPVDWAMTQNNLGTAYSDCIKEDRGENLELAIASFQLALEVYTREAFPVDWATTQNNLGVAYQERIKEDRGENLELAITAFQKALEVRTREAFPVDWATTQNNLGIAYGDRIKEDRGENLELAIAAFQLALEVYTCEAFPVQWATTQNNLGIAYRDRIKEDRGENLELAIAAFQLALEVYTPEADPYKCINTGRNLGNLGFDQGRWDIAIEGYQSAIEALETARNWAKTDQRRQEILADGIQMYENIVQCYINLGQYDTAIEYSDRSRSKTLSDFMASHELYQGDIDPTVREDIRKHQAIQTHINNLLKEIQTSPAQELAGVRKYNPPEYSTSLKGEIERLEGEKQRLWEAIRRQDPVIAGLVTVPPPLTVRQMQQLIDNPKTAIVCFYSTIQDTHVFVLRHRDAIHPQLQLFTITGQGIDTLQQWLFDDWFMTYLKNFQRWHNSMEDLLGELSQRLQLDRLINEHLQDLEELIIVPHLSLHQIAFAALPIGLGVGERENQGDVNSIDSESLIRNENKKNDDLSNSSRSTRMVKDFCEDVKVRKIDPKTETKTKTANLCLGDRFRLRIIPSLQILNYCHERETLNPCSMGIVENATEDLVFTPYECETIAQEYSNFQATASGTIAQGFSVLKRLKGKDAIAHEYYKVSHEVSILHSSHHASFNPNDPLNSLLLLADQELRLGELINWRTPKLLDVFLSCCETNVNSPKLTDDVLTLATAFLCIGARNVVCTQWAVDDFASALITVFYYQFRQQNNSRPRALQLAQNRLRELSQEELNTKYKDSLHNYCIQQKQYYIELKQTADNNKNEKLSNKLDQLIKKLDNQIDIILPYHCRQKQPFKSPYYWSGFTCQGLT